MIAGSPPASHLARHGLMATVEGYHLMVDPRHERPNEEMLADLAAGQPRCRGDVGADRRAAGKGLRRRARW